MTQKHNMPKPRDADRKIMLDYLEATFPRAHGAARLAESVSEAVTVVVLPTADARCGD